MFDMATKPNRTTNRTRKPGAVAVGDRQRGGAGWLKWLLPLLLLLGLAILLISLLSGGDDKKKSSSARTPSSASAGSNVLKANGKTVRGDQPATLTGAIGQPATGTGAKVLSVASGSGFWVGTSNADRTFIEYGSTVGGNEDQPYKPKVGDTVDLRGPVRPAPANPSRTLMLNDQDAAQLKAEGAYINADKVTAR